METKEDKVFGTSQKSSQRENYICNFRAPNMEWFNRWQKVKEFCEDRGMDICMFTLASVWSMKRACERAEEGLTPEPTTLTTPFHVLNLQQNVTIIYSVDKPRRGFSEESLNCSSGNKLRTNTRDVAESIIIEKAHHLKRSFCFRDFMEIDHNLFRKAILSLKNKGKVKAILPRTNPRFYILTEWLEQRLDYFGTIE